MRLRPLQDRVVVRPAAPEARTSGGIFIPDTAQKKAMEGEVVAVGPGARDAKGILIAAALKAGDRVWFAHWSGTAFKMDGEDLIVLTESDILGLIDGAVAHEKAA